MLGQDDEPQIPKSKWVCVIACAIWRDGLMVRVRLPQCQHVNAGLCCEAARVVNTN